MQVYLCVAVLFLNKELEKLPRSHTLLQTDKITDKAFDSLYLLFFVRNE